MILAQAITVLACVMVVGVFMSVGYTLYSMVYGYVTGRDLDEVVVEVYNKHMVDDEIAAATAALVKPVAPTGEIAEIAASMEAKRKHERSKA